MPANSIPPRDPARVSRVTNAMAFPIALGMGATFLLGYHVDGKLGGIVLAAVYFVAAVIVAVRVLKSAAVDNYARGIGGQDGWVGAALASAEVVQTLVADRSDPS